MYHTHSRSIDALVLVLSTLIELRWCCERHVVRVVLNIQNCLSMLGDSCMQHGLDLGRFIPSTHASSHDIEIFGINHVVGMNGKCFNLEHRLGLVCKPGRVYEAKVWAKCCLPHM